MKLKTIDDEQLLLHFRVRRREMVDAIHAADNPPSDEAIRKLAHLQQAIAAVEGVIADKKAEGAQP